LTPAILAVNGFAPSLPCRHWGPLHLVTMTPREKLHLLVDELSEAEAEAALARLVRERELLARWTEPEAADAAEDAWALGNAREAIREEPW
jgi:hypothetical protein